MPHYTRYLILSCCIIIFLIIAPILVVFTSGYKPNLETKSLEQTGLIRLVTEPSGATIIINNELAGTSPLTKRFLRAGQYDIKIEKSGFRPLFFSTEILPNGIWERGTTEPITLISETKAEKIAEQVSSCEAHSKIIVCFNWDSFKTIDHDTGQTMYAMKVPEPILSMHSNGSGSRILFLSSKTAYLWSDEEPEKIFSIAESSLSPEARIFWLSSDVVSVLSQGELSHYQFVLPATPEKISTEQTTLKRINTIPLVETACQLDGALYTIEKKQYETGLQSGAHVLRVFQANTPTEPTTIQEFASSTTQACLITEQKEIFLWKKNLQLTQLLPSAEETVIAHDVTEVQELPNQQTFIFYTKTELFGSFLKRNDRTITLLDRQSSTLPTPALFDRTQSYIIKTIGNEIRMSYIFERNQNNQFTLFSGTKPQLLATDKKFLWFTDNGALFRINLAQ